MKVTFPSTCATPTPSWSMDSMTASVTASLALRLRHREVLAHDLLGDRHAIDGVVHHPGIAVREGERQRPDLAEVDRRPRVRVERRPAGDVQVTRVRIGRAHARAVR